MLTNPSNLLEAYIKFIQVKWNKENIPTYENYAWPKDEISIGMSLNNEIPIINGMLLEFFVLKMSAYKLRI